MKLVEVVRTQYTDPTIFDVCKEWVKSIDKHPVSCKDTPGFIVNRCHEEPYRKLSFDLLTEVDDRILSNIKVEIASYILKVCVVTLTLSRLLIPSLAQSMLMLDRGDGSIEDIDKSLELGAGHPMGPLVLAVRLYIFPHTAYVNVNTTDR